MTETIKMLLEKKETVKKRNIYKKQNKKGKRRPLLEEIENIYILYILRNMFWLCILFWYCIIYAVFRLSAPFWLYTPSGESSSFVGTVELHHHLYSFHTIDNIQYYTFIALILSVYFYSHEIKTEVYQPY